MKLSDAFITHDDGEEKLVVSTGSADFSGLARGNATAGFIIECLENDTTEEEIVDKMLKKFDAPRDVIANDVHKIVEKLRSIGAIDD